MTKIYNEKRGSEITKMKIDNTFGYAKLISTGIFRSIQLAKAYIF